MIDSPEIVAGRLRALRKELGFKTQTAFADKIGIDKSTYNLYENGKRPLTFETALMIRRQWNISIDWLFFGDLGTTAHDMIVKLGRFPGDAERAQAAHRKPRKHRDRAA